MQKACALTLRAPVIICVSTKVIVSKISLQDQKASSAAVCQLITLAANMLGYACIWRTGKYAMSKLVKVRLAIDPADDISGFIYLGSLIKKKRQLGLILQIKSVFTNNK